jgi:hypothetical protein
MTSNAARQRTILKTYKDSETDEAQAKIHYYVDARDGVLAYHRNNRPAGWLIEKAATLEAQASLESGRRRTKLRHNGRALRAYENFFGSKTYEILPASTLPLVYAGVRVIVRPDLHVIENGKEKIMKLDFSVTEPSTMFSRIISQCLFEAACNNGISLPSASVIFLDVPRGRSHKGARVGARMKKDIEASCMTIAAIWDGI